MKARTKRIIGKSGLILVALGFLGGLAWLIGPVIGIVIVWSCAAFFSLIFWLVSWMETED